MWLHFVSYKFARLLAPFVFVLLLASSFGLPSPWRETALLLQAAFYGFALLDPLVPEGLAGKRWTSVARTFVTLMAAAACALAILFVPSARLWKPTRRENAEPSA
jgi:hypothetical protein